MIFITFIKSLDKNHKPQESLSLENILKTTIVHV